MRNNDPLAGNGKSSATRSRRLTRLGIALGGLACASMVAAAPAVAGKPSGGSHKGGGKTSSTSSLSLVLLDSVDGAPHHGQDISFEVSTDATAEPRVSVTCHQNGTLVYSGVTGYFEDYPWPYTNVFTLSSRAWTGGAADCSAELYWYDGRKTVTGAVLDFPVLA